KFGSDRRVASSHELRPWKTFIQPRGWCASSCRASIDRSAEHREAHGKKEARPKEGQARRKDGETAQGPSEPAEGAGSAPPRREGSRAPHNRPRPARCRT